MKLNFSNRRGMRKIRVLLLAALTVSQGVPGFAGDKIVNVQGVLQDSGGQPLSGAQTVTFRLYTSSTAAVNDKIWQDQVDVTLQDGAFNVPLGQVTSLDSIAFDKPLYLGIQVTSDAEMTPRKLLGASPYANGSVGDFSAGGAIDAVGRITLHPSKTEHVTPNGRLHIAAAYDHIVLEDTDGVADHKKWIIKSDDKKFEITAANDAWSQWAAAMMFDRDGMNVHTVRFPLGNVGLGVWTPQARLDVDGPIKFRDSSGTGIVHADSSGNMKWKQYLRSDSAMSFWDTTDRLTLTPGGNVGVGTNAPQELLHVAGKGRFVGAISEGLGSGDEPRRGTLRVTGTGDASSGRLVVLEGPWPEAFEMDRYFITGWTNYALRFYIRGDGFYYNGSSRKWKTDIAKYPQALSKIEQLEGVSYRWKNDETGQKVLGFVAEDLAKVIPEAVHNNEYVNYSAVIPVLVEAIKELKAKVEQLEKKSR